MNFVVDDSAHGSDPVRKVIRYDTRTNTATLIEGEPDFFGFPLDESMGIGPGEILKLAHPDDVETLMQALERTPQLKEGDSMTFNFRGRHVDGYFLEVRCLSRPEKWNAQHQVISVIIETESRRIP